MYGVGLFYVVLYNSVINWLNVIIYKIIIGSLRIAVQFALSQESFYTYFKAVSRTY